MEKFGEFVVTMMLLVANAIMSGFVIAKLWGWFIVSTFCANPLRIVEAIGLSLVIGVLTVKINPKEKGDFIDLLERFIYSLLYYSFALLIGWIIYYWI